MPLLRPIPTALLTVLVLAVVACSDSSGPNPNPNPNPQPNTTPASLTIVAGNNQSALAGEALGTALTVRVENSDGDPLTDVTVSWTVQAGGGALGSATSMTNAQGQATNTYTLGPSAMTNTVRASIASTSLTADFNATATAPITDFVPASLQIASGNNQQAPVNTQLANPLVVLVQNTAGQALPGIDIAWSVTAGGGALGSPSSASSTSGQASVTFTVGAIPGASTIRGEVQSNSALNVAFTATAFANPTQADVSVEDSFYVPSSVTIAPGGTVTWTWAGSLGHSVTWVSGGFPEAATKASGTHVVTFATAGTYTYYCVVHGTPTSGMRGTVVVQ